MKKTVVIISIVIAVGILGFVAYSLLTSSKVPQAFIDKHNEKVALEKEATQAADLNSLPEWSNVDKQISEKSYTNALKTIETGLSRKKEAAAKLNAIDGKLSELKSLSEKITDSKVKTSADNFIETAKKENSAKSAYNNLQIQMIEKLKAMVDILEKNPNTISTANEKIINTLSNEINSLKTQINEAETALNTIQSQYKVAETDFFKLAGLEVEK
ncbi:MAG: hypothetical protein WCT08_04935 [Patescibacteria group bacterium]|jgi:hypothetical protein